MVINTSDLSAQGDADGRDYSESRRINMKFLKLGVLAATAALALSSAPGSASAAIVSECKLNTVQVTSLTPLGSSTTINGPVNATQCLKVKGNPFAINKGKAKNLGELNVGLLNGETQGNVSINPIGFLNGRPLVDADRDGSGAVDPGWIYIGSNFGNSINFKYAEITSPFGTQSSRSISDFVSFAVNAEGDRTKGTWRLTPSDTIVKDLQAFIGSAYFDSLAIILKGNNDFVIYDLDFSGANLDLTIPYVLSGTWNTGDLSESGKKMASLTEFAVWVRDPIPSTTTEVPEPTTLALLGLSLLGLGSASRRRKI